MMNLTARLLPAPIDAVEIAEGTPREAAMKRHFERHDVRIESEAYALIRRLAPTYRHCDWRLRELSNGGAFLAPRCEPLQLQVDRSGRSVQVSADAAGIIVCLLTLRQFSMRYEDNLLFRQFYLLRDFAREHAEAGQILAATD